MGLVKATVLLGFTLAAYNLDRVRSFKAKHGLDHDVQAVEQPKHRRARRRAGVGRRSSTRPIRLAHPRRRPAVPSTKPASRRTGFNSSRKHYD